MANKMINKIDATIDKAFEGANLTMRLRGNDGEDISIEAARRALSNDDISTILLDDDTAYAVYHSREALKSVASGSIEAAYALGIIKASKVYQITKEFTDGSAKRLTFKDFLDEYYPDYAYKTLALYADVGYYIYAPIEAGLDGYKDYAWMLDKSPAMLKQLVSVFKDPSRLAELPNALNKALPDGQSKHTARSIESAARATKPTNPKLPDGKADNPDNAPTHTDIVALAKMFMFGTTDDGEIEVLIPDKASAKHLLKQCMDDPNKAVAFLEWFAGQIG